LTLFIQVIEEGESKGRKTRTVLFSYIYVYGLHYN